MEKNWVYPMGYWRKLPAIWIHRDILEGDGRAVIVNVWKVVWEPENLV